MSKRGSLKRLGERVRGHHRTRSAEVRRRSGRKSAPNVPPQEKERNSALGRVRKSLLKGRRSLLRAKSRDNGADDMHQAVLDQFAIYRQLFGKGLEDLKPHPLFAPIPEIVIYWTEMMRAKDAVETDGVFRVPGEHDEIKRIESELLINEHKDFDWDSVGIYSICDAYKSFWKCTSEPLVPYEHYDIFLNLISEGAYDQITQIIEEQFPEVNRVTLFYLVDFLAEVAAEEETNRMSVSNLACVFGPNIMRDEEEPSSLAHAVNQSNKASSLMKYLIEGRLAVYSPAAMGNDDVKM